MAVKSGITCDALDWWSHHVKRTGFVGLVYNYLTITKTGFVVLVLVYYQDYFCYVKVKVSKVPQVDTICWHKVSGRTLSASC